MCGLETIAIACPSLIGWNVPIEKNHSEKLYTWENLSLSQRSRHSIVVSPIEYGSSKSIQSPEKSQKELASTILMLLGSKLKQVSL